ncbi:unnamed protein product, partial [Oppiella nova]
MDAGMEEEEVVVVVEGI